MFIYISEVFFTQKKAFLQNKKIHKSGTCIFKSAYLQDKFD